MIPLFIQTIEDENDRQFMTRLYLDYYGMMRRCALYMTCDEHVAQDIVSSTVVKLIEQIVTLRSLSHNAVAAYLAVSIKRVSIDYFRSTHASLEREFYYAQEWQMEQGCENTVEHAVFGKLNAEMLRKAIGRLSQKDQTLLQFKYLLDMDDAAIASALRIGKNSVRQYLTRARRRVYVLLSQEQGLER